MTTTVEAAPVVNEITAAPVVHEMLENLDLGHFHLDDGLAADDSETYLVRYPRPLRTAAPPLLRVTAAPDATCFPIQRRARRFYYMRCQRFYFFPD
jgi:hypothetical protein